jgi:hypothetical protein
MNTIVLKAELQASSKGVKIDKPYRAVMRKNKADKWVIAVEQPIRDDWFTTGGQWYLSTLLEHPYRDSIAIDYGQEWHIDSGLWAALEEAISYI